MLQRMRSAFLIKLRRWIVPLAFASFTITIGVPAKGGIVYSVLSEVGIWSIYHQENIGSKPRLVPVSVGGDASAPSLSPDGKRVAFELTGVGIDVCSLGPGGDCSLIQSSRGNGTRPAWWADTGRLVFVQYKADAEGEDSEIFTTGSGLRSSHPLITQTGLLDYPDISPDGLRIAYTVADTVSLHQGGVQVVQTLWVMDLATGRAKQLLLTDAQDIHPAWSPSGEQLAFASNRSGLFDIWVINHEGNDLRQLTTGPGSKTWPAWSPNGRSILFTRAQDGRQSLLFVDADGSNLRPFEPFGPDVQKELRDADWR